jgi:hypothetical protein
MFQEGLSVQFNQESRTPVHVSAQTGGERRAAGPTLAFRKRKQQSKAGALWEGRPSLEWTGRTLHNRQSRIRIGCARRSSNVKRRPLVERSIHTTRTRRRDHVDNGRAHAGVRGSTSDRRQKEFACRIHAGLTRIITQRIRRRQHQIHLRPTRSTGVVSHDQGPARCGDYG